MVLDHVDRRYLDAQIPGGTIEPGEAPEAAALREAFEETGLKNLTSVAKLGSFEKDLRPLGRAETIHAWFYHLTTNEPTQPRWRHFELDPSDGTEPIEFELYWVPLDRIPKLGGIDETLLPELLLSAQLCNRDPGR